MKHLDKRSIDDLNIEEARGWVLDRSNVIEKYLNNIIIRHLGISEERRAFADNMLLSSSVISFGSKIKVVQGIVDSKKLLDNLRRLLAIRNGFAHAIVQDQVELIKDEETDEVMLGNIEKVINVMNAAGIIKTKSYKEYLNEFFELNKAVKEELLVLRKENKI